VSWITKILNKLLDSWFNWKVTNIFSKGEIVRAIEQTQWSGILPSTGSLAITSAYSTGSANEIRITDYLIDVKIAGVWVYKEAYSLKLAAHLSDTSLKALSIHYKHPVAAAICIAYYRLTRKTEKEADWMWQGRDKKYYSNLGDFVLKERGLAVP
jgi:hypothetical protein